MARKKAPAPAPAPMAHHEAMGQAAHAAMRALPSGSITMNPMDFNVIGSPAAQEDFTPRAYAAKPNPKG